MTHRFFTSSRIVFFSFAVLVGACFFVSPTFAIDLSLNRERTDIALDAQRVVIAGNDFDHHDQFERDIGFSIERIRPSVVIRWFGNGRQALATFVQPATLQAHDANTAEWATVFQTAAPQGATRYELEVTRQDRYGDYHVENNTQSDHVNPGNLHLEKPDLVVDERESVVGNTFQDILIRNDNPNAAVEQQFRVSFIWTYADENDLASDAMSANAVPLANGNWIVHTESRQPRGALGYVVSVDTGNTVRETNELNNSFVSFDQEEGPPPDLFLDDGETVVGDASQEIVIRNSGDNNFRAPFFVTFVWVNDDGSQQGNVFGAEATLGEDGKWRVFFQESQPDHATSYSIFVDSRSQILESNENNNTVTREVPSRFAQFVHNVVAAVGNWGNNNDRNNEHQDQATSTGRVTARDLERAVNVHVDPNLRLKRVWGVSNPVSHVSIGIEVENTEILADQITMPRNVSAEIRILDRTNHHAPVTQRYNLPAFADNSSGQSVIIGWRSLPLGPNDVELFDIDSLVNQMIREGGDPYQMEIVLDPDNDVVETNERDNTSQRSFLPDLVPVGFSFIPCGDPESHCSASEDTYHMDITIQNRHPEFTPGEFDVLVYFLDENGRVIRSNNVSSGELSDTINVPHGAMQGDIVTVWEIAHIPEHTASVYVELDFLHHIQEESEQNNILQVGFGRQGMNMVLVPMGERPQGVQDALNENAEQCEAGIAPGSVLYPFERAAERVREVFVRNQERRAELFEARACERQAEVEALVEENNVELAQEYIADVEHARTQARQAVAQMKNEGNSRWEAHAETVVRQATIQTVYYADHGATLGKEFVSQKVEETVNAAADFLARVGKGASEESVSGLPPRHERRTINWDEGSNVSAEQKKQDITQEIQTRAYEKGLRGSEGKTAPDTNSQPKDGSVSVEKDSILTPINPVTKDGTISVEKDSILQPKTDGTTAVEKDSILIPKSTAKPSVTVEKDSILAPKTDGTTSVEKDSILQPAPTTVTKPPVPTTQPIPLTDTTVKPSEPAPTQTICPTMKDPVCGIDGRTYDNACFADKARMLYAPGSCDGALPEQAEPIVFITNSGFEPAKITVSRGAIIRFVNDSSNAHSIVGDAKTSEIRPGASVRIGMPDQPGTFRYTSSFNGNMSGVIVVE